jgi:hypothetical protein
MLLHVSPIFNFLLSTLLHKRSCFRLAMVALICNTSHSGGRDQKDFSSRTGWAKMSARPISTNKLGVMMNPSYVRNINRRMTTQWYPWQKKMQDPIQKVTKVKKGWEQCSCCRVTSKCKANPSTAKTNKKDHVLKDRSYFGFFPLESHRPDQI